MQHIQDKKFDNLFKSAFDDAEIQPSAHLWSAIEKEIAPKKKRKFPVLWLSAASIALVVSFVLFNKEEKMQMQGKVKLKPEKIIPPIETLPIVEDKVAEYIAYSAPSKASHTPTTLKKEVLVTPPIIETKVSTGPEVNIAQVTPPTETYQAVISVDKPAEPIVVYAQVNTEALNTELAEYDKNDKKGIRNVGDLVNFVVDKVDKRDKKAIKFETKDDESSIIAFNIGILKFNKRR